MAVGDSKETELQFEQKTPSWSSTDSHPSSKKRSMDGAQFHLVWVVEAGGGLKLHTCRARRNAAHLRRPRLGIGRGADQRGLALQNHAHRGVHEQLA